jgi:hypothetical protein
LAPSSFHLFDLLRNHLCANASLMTKRLKQRCGSCWDTSKKFLCCGFRGTVKVMGQVYQCWWRICGEINAVQHMETCNLCCWCEN